MEIITLLNIFALGWLVPLVQCQTAQLSPPTNVSLSWINMFCYKLSWIPRVEHKNCRYSLGERRVVDPVQYVYTSMEGGLLNVSVSAVCDNRESAKVYSSLAFPELVRDFNCALQSLDSLNCTWRPAKHVEDFHLYYWQSSLSAPSDNDNCVMTFDLAECRLYQSDANDAKVGCVLSLNFSDAYFFFLFNGTVDGALARNTFQRTPTENMRPPALHWTGDVDDDQKLSIKWLPINFGAHWEYILNYTECGMRKITTLTTSPYVLRLGHCEFNITLNAKDKTGYGETPPGPHRVYGINTNPHTWLILAFTLIPAVVVVILVVALVCFRKHRKSIFPQVPAPQDFLPAMLNSNSSPPKALYVPMEVEEPQNVTFLIKPESRSDHSA